MSGEHRSSPPTEGAEEKRYRPLTLGVERVIRGQPPLVDCVRHFSTLTSGLAALHQAGRSVRGRHAFEGRLRAAKRVGLISVGIAAVALGAFGLASWTARIERESRGKTEAALQRVATAEHYGRLKLYDSLVAGAVAERRTDLMGRRFRALDIIKKAAEIRPSAGELRDAAISALALPDARETHRLILPEWAAGQGLGADLATRFITETNGTTHARRIADDQELFTLPGKATRSAFVWPLDPDGRWLAVERDNNPTEWWDLNTRQLEPLFRNFSARESPRIIVDWLASARSDGLCCWISRPASHASTSTSSATASPVRSRRSSSD